MIETKTWRLTLLSAHDTSIITRLEPGDCVFNEVFKYAPLFSTTHPVESTNIPRKLPRLDWCKARKKWEEMKEVKIGVVLHNRYEDQKSQLTIFWNK